MFAHSRANMQTSPRRVAKKSETPFRVSDFLMGFGGLERPTLRSRVKNSPGDSPTGHQVNVYRIPCREQLWLFRRPHFHAAESVGEKVTPCEFAVKIPHMAGGTAERS